MQLLPYVTFKTNQNVRLLSILLFYFIFGSLIYYRLLKDPGIWNYGDTMFPFDMKFLGNYNDLVYKTWWDHEYLGHNTIIEGIGRSSFVALLNFGYLIFNDMSTAQFFYWVLLFTISGTTMFWLVTSTFEGGITAFSASLFYALNPWIINRIAHVLFVQAYAFMPLIYTSYVLWLDKKEIKYMVLFSITSIFIIPSPHFIFIILIILVTYFLYRQTIAKSLAERARYIVYSLKLCFVTLSFLGFYLLPIIGYLCTGGQEAIRMQTAMLNLAPMAIIYGRDCTLLNVIRLLGFHDSIFRGSVLGSLLSSEQPSSWVALSFIIPLLWSIPLFFFNEHKLRDIPFFYTLILIGIFLSTITTIFDARLFQYLMFIPFVNDPNIYVSVIAFSSAAICGIAISIIKNRVEKYNGKRYSMRLNIIIFVSLILLTSFITYPYFLWTDRRYEQALYPPEYHQAANYIDQHPEDSRVLMLPPFASIRHKWAPYIWLQSSDGYLFTKPFFGRVTVESTPIGSASISQLIDKGLRDNSFSIATLLSFTNTRYILVTDDIMPDLPYLPLNPNLTKDYIHTLNSQEGILLERIIGDIFIYKLEDSYFLPHLYIPEAIYYVRGSNLSDLLWLSYLHNNSKLAAVFSMDDSIQINVAGYYNLLAIYKGNPTDRIHTNATGIYKIKIGDKLFSLVKRSSGSNLLLSERMYLQEGKIDITVYRQYPDGSKIISRDLVLTLCSEIHSLPHIIGVEKVDSTEYILRIRANRSFYFVFSESFDNNWRVSISGPNLSWIEKLSFNHIDEKVHLMVNGYANMWYVDPQELKANELTITIYYWPQSLYMIGLIITIITVISFMLYFIWRVLYTKTSIKWGKSSIERSS